jgi:Flp pilus assembly protein TadB
MHTWLQVLLAVGLVVGCLCWRRRSKRRAIQAQEFQAATYFSNSECVFSSRGDHHTTSTSRVDCVW